MTTIFYPQSEQIFIYTCNRNAFSLYSNSNRPDDARNRDSFYRKNPVNSSVCLRVGIFRELCANVACRIQPTLEFELIASCDFKYRGASTSAITWIFEFFLQNRPVIANRRATTAATTPLLRIRDFVEFDVGWQAGTRPVQGRASASTTVPLVRAVSTRRCARNPCAGASMRARWRGFFPPFLPSRRLAVPALPCPARHLRPSPLIISRYCARLAFHPALAHAASLALSFLLRGRPGSDSLVLLLIRLHQLVALVVNVVLKVSLLLLLTLRLIKLCNVF